jgi:hypothetical protein
MSETASACEHLNKKCVGDHGVVCADCGAIISDGREPLAVLQDAIAAKDAQIKRLRERLANWQSWMLNAGAMNEPPCFICGYNGEGYYNESKHPCATLHHEACGEGP